MFKKKEIARKFYLDKSQAKGEIIIYIFIFSIISVIYIILNLLNVPNFINKAVIVIFLMYILFAIISLLFSPSFDTIEVYDIGYTIKRKMKKKYVNWGNVNEIRTGMKLEKFTGKPKEKIVIEFQNKKTKSMECEYLPSQIELLVELQKSFDAYKYSEGNYK